MRIGLVRHFPVNHAMPSGWMTAADLTRWREAYEAAEVTAGVVDVGTISWQQCWASDAPRAWVTAQAAFAGPIKALPQLREAEIAEFPTGKLSLPAWAWRYLLRLAWATAHPWQRSARDGFLQRVREMAEQLAAQEQDTLVVCHAGVMHFLRAELGRRGFTGPKFALAQHARVYVFERPKAGGGT